MKTVVSAFALAASLAATPVLAEDIAAPTTPAEVSAWVKSADQAYADQTVAEGHAAWIYQTYINEDSEIVAAQASSTTTKLQVANALAAARAAGVSGLDPATRRQLTMFRTQITSP